jgi:hypothetical protein
MPNGPIMYTHHASNYSTELNGLCKYSSAESVRRLRELDRKLSVASGQVGFRLYSHRFGEFHWGEPVPLVGEVAAYDAKKDVLDGLRDGAAGATADRQAIY